MGQTTLIEEKLKKMFRDAGLDENLVDAWVAETIANTLFDSSNLYPLEKTNAELHLPE